MVFTETTQSQFESVRWLLHTGLVLCRQFATGAGWI